MTMKVTGPDGSTFNFPDGTSFDTINGVLHKHYGTAPPEIGTGEDVARGVGAGLAGGTAGLAGGAGDIQQSLMGSGLDAWLTRKAHEILPEAFFKAARPGGYSLARPEVGEIRLPTTKEVLQPFARPLEAAGLGHQTNLSDLITGKAKGGFELYEPHGLLGKLAKGGAEFVPGAVTGTSARSVPGLLADVARFGVAPGVAQEGVGQLFKGTRYEGTPVETAARLATSLGTSAGAGKFISPNLSKKPIASREAYEGQVRQLEDRGLPISPGERSDVRALRYGESERNPELATERLEAVTRQATSAVGNGQGGNHGVNVMVREPGHNTLDNILRETGTRVRDTWAPVSFVADAELGNDIRRLQHEYTATDLYGEDTVRRVNGAIAELQNAMTHAVSTGQVLPTGLPYLTGEQAHRLYSRIRTAARGTENTNTARGLNEFANALGDTLERRVAGTPMEGRLAEANHDYRNALVVEHASKASNVAGAAGHITPAKLEEAANQVMGARVHQRGYDDFSWAPAAKSVYKIMPDSGTSPREQYHSLFKNIGRAVGSITGAIGGGVGGGGVEKAVLGAIVGADAGAGPLGYAAKKLFGGYAGTRLGQMHLGNQLLAGQPGPLHERVYNPATGETTRRYSVPGLLTAAQTLEQQRQRDEQRGLLQ